MNIASSQHDPLSRQPQSDEQPTVLARSARTSLWLFAVYLIFYGGFMGLNAFAPRLMAAEPLGGVNLAILYGIALILAAVVLALAYLVVSRPAAERGDSDDQTGETLAARESHGSRGEE
jgi:uncharacterized membrane protein (DUF485 family)